MPHLGRVLIWTGVALFVLGLLLSYTDMFSALRLGRLPGDISIKRENFAFYFPIVTCLLISLALSLIVYLLKK